MQTTRQTKPIPFTKEERRINRELQDHIRHMGPEHRSVLLVMAREIAQPGTMHELLFNARSI